ncbi:MAG TPA: glutathione S-transferase family protein [Phenylobacterium sp.]|jgi:glutathione S-transferase|uniref:glutathione S-transferase family protein n=1 Tax=Phenylobacterium sp. TaxID=1871053 RepID=UPI002C9FBF72|nr:glutathione S-transferase family protein [Phenylobacterium sp.]HXA37870.1 glutathione S-transferase family protein [Phenylobacterium sp.]
MNDEIILHHYDSSPFSEKVRVMLGVKALSWRSVIQPVIMPKPELTPLTGGYRRIPVMQIGADVYCDTQVILAELEARHRKPAVARGADWAVNLWADRLFFQTTVAVVFGATADQVPKAFIEDREKLSGRPFDMAVMKAAAVPMRAQWRAHAAWIERGLASNDFLGGSTPSLADIAAYMNVWWLGRAAPGVAAELLDGLPKTAGWRERVKALGHGRRNEMSGGEALKIAMASTPATAPAAGPADPSALRLGDAVAVRADDYGRDPIEGRLVAVTSERITVARDDGELDLIHVHFPRVGYVLTAA